MFIEQDRTGAGYIAVRIVLDPPHESRIIKVDDFGARGRSDLPEQGGLAHRPGPFQQHDRVGVHAAENRVEDATADRGHEARSLLRISAIDLPKFRILP